MFGKWRTAKHVRTISEKRFEAIARLEAKRIKRIESLEVDGYTVHGTVRTVTGIATWKFSAYFDQDGAVTGAYRVWSENDESSIPREYAKSVSNAVKAYLAESDGQPDKVTSDTPLDLAMEIEKVRLEGVSIVQRAEDQARQIRAAAQRDAERTLSEARREADAISASARELYDKTVSSAQEDAGAVNDAAREFYDKTVSSAQEEAKSIRLRAIAEAEEIKNDAEEIAQERREMRARRRALIAKHRKALFAACACLILTLALAIVLVRRDAQAKFEAKLIPAGVESTDCAGIQYREIEGQLAKSGFTNISCIATADLDAESLKKEGTTSFVTIEGKGVFHPEDQFPYDAEVNVYYLTAMQLRAPMSSQKAAGMDVDYVKKSFMDSGFANVRIEAIKDLIVGFTEKPNAVASVTVNGDDSYSPSDTLRPDDEIVIYYHDYRWASD